MATVFEWMKWEKMYKENATEIFGEENVDREIDMRIEAMGRHRTRVIGILKEFGPELKKLGFSSEQAILNYVTDIKPNIPSHLR
jgi:hypothetical protein